jgi:hypothetical protein
VTKIFCAFSSLLLRQIALVGVAIQLSEPDVNLARSVVVLSIHVAISALVQMVIAVDEKY